METQNITLSLPKDVLKKVKHLAVEKDTSVSRMLTEMLIEMVIREDNYLQARAHHTRLLRQARDLGTKGQVRYSRGELHARGQ